MSHLPSNNQSWLDPSGNFHPIDRSVFLSHEAWAKGNWKTLGFKTKYKFPPTALYKKGWLRVKKDGNTLWVSNAARVPPNDRQKPALQYWAIENPAIKQITFEDGVIQKIIWPENDYEYHEVNFKEWFIKNNKNNNI